MTEGASSVNLTQQAVQLSYRFGPIKHDDYALNQLSALRAQDWQTQMKILKQADGSLEMPAKDESCGTIS